MIMIYRLYINNTTIYIGKTKNMKERYRAHKKACYNSNAKRGYNSKKYLSIRQLGITREQFNQYVKYEILYQDIPDEYGKTMENLIIKLYRENGINLWNELNGLFDEEEAERKRKILLQSDEQKKKAIIRAQKNYEANREAKLEYGRQYHHKNKEKINKKIQCPLCNLQLNKASLNRHIRRKHK